MRQVPSSRPASHRVVWIWAAITLVCVVGVIAYGFWSA
jgi:hypothetical protein